MTKMIKINARFIRRQHVFYKNIYIFVNKLKNLIKLSMIDIVERMRRLISSCFRNKTFI